MDRRFGQLTGLFAITLVILRLGRLLLAGPEYINWQMILIASVVLGGVVWWLLGQLLTIRWMAVTVFGLGGLVLFLRVATPETLTFGVFPSTETSAALQEQMSQAVHLIRFGVPQIEPLVGVIAILAVLMWIIGALYSWGLSGGPVAAMILPSLVLYLQFAVFDREPAGLPWMLASAAMLALIMVALGLERRTETGRARDSDGRPLPRRSPALALVTAGTIGVIAVAVATSVSGLVSEYGNVLWRAGGSGYGLGSGGVTFDRFVDLRQNLVDLPETLLFEGSLAEGAPPAGQIYWRMETLDEFDGIGWKRSTLASSEYTFGVTVGDPAHEYQGSTTNVLMLVQIAGLRQAIAPTAGVIAEIQSVDGDGAIDPTDFRTGTDSSLIYRPVLGAGDLYQVRATYARPDDDLAALATGVDGELSPIFANAAEAGTVSITPETIDRPITRPGDIDSFTNLPDGVPGKLRGIAFAQTRGASTDFERAFLLENWFRGGEFTYSTDVSTGHGSLDLAAWLTDPDSPNYKIGYCEQFASSMAVLGRVLDIPSRVVWGFTPGTPVQYDDREVIEVRGTNAHAWVEMWIDGFGWVRFDPTPRGDLTQPTATFDPTGLVPEIEAGAVAPGLPVPGDLIGNEDPIPSSQPPTEVTPRWWLFAVLAVPLLLSVVPTAKAMRRRRRLRLIREGDITAVWDELVDRLTDLGEPVEASKTPLEVARETDPALVRLAMGYSATIYGGRAGQAKETDLAEAELWLVQSFDRSDRARAALTPRSLFRRS